MLIALVAQSIASVPIFLDGWMIYHRPDESSCIMEQPQRDNTTVRIGLASSHPGVVFVVLHNPAWASVRQGGVYQVSGDLGGVPYFADGVGLDRAIRIEFRRQHFLDKFYRGQRVTVFREGIPLLNMSWRARQATWALVDCMSGATDPFRS